MDNGIGELENRYNYWSQPPKLTLKWKINVIPSKDNWDYYLSTLLYKKICTWAYKCLKQWAHNTHRDNPIHGPGHALIGLPLLNPPLNFHYWALLHKWILNGPHCPGPQEKTNLLNLKSGTHVICFCCVQNSIK